MAEQEDEYFRFLLVGKTGSGKSTTGNTIFGEDLFSSSVSFSSVTTECDLQRSKQPGRVIEIMDCPGLFDTNKTEDELHNAIVKAVIGTHPGPHAVLYVIKIGRYTTEDFEVYSRLKHVFDANISNYMIVIFTHGDLLEKTNKELKDLLSHAPKQLHQVVSECSGRCVVFNNAAKEKQRYVGQLLQEVRALKTQNGDQPYVCSKYANIAEGVKAEVYFRVLNANKQVVETGIEAGDDVLAEMEREEAMTDEQKTEAYQVELDRLRDEITRDNDPSYVAWAVQNLYTAVSASYHFAGSSVRSRGPGYRARLRHFYQRYTGKCEQEDLEGEPTFRFLLVGKTGSGKSATGNTILGRTIFNVALLMDSLTNRCQLERGRVNGNLVEIMDSPGLYDTRTSHEEIARLIVQAVACMNPGPHAVLHTVPIGHKYTDEEYKTFLRLKAYLDEEVTKYMIIVFTRGDELEEENLSIDTYLRRTEGNFRQVLAECKRRHVVFNNKTKKRTKQVDKLLEVVGELLKENNGAHYECKLTRDVDGVMNEEISRRVAEANKKEAEENEYVRDLATKKAKAEDAAATLEAKAEEQNRLARQEQQQKEAVMKTLEKQTARTEELEKEKQTALEEAEKMRLQAEEVKAEAEKRMKEADDLQRQTEEQKKLKEQERKRIEWEIKLEIAQNRITKFTRQLRQFGLRFFSVDFDSENFKCHHCEEKIGVVSDLIKIETRKAKQTMELRGVADREVVVHNFENTLNQKCRVLTLNYANVLQYGEGHREDQTGLVCFFPGCTWWYALCPSCKQQKGWVYDAGPTCASGSYPYKRFYGIFVNEPTRETTERCCIS